MRTSPISRGMIALFSSLNRIPLSNTQGVVNAIENSPSQVNDGDLYLRVDITGKGGITELLDSNTRKIDGVSSFDKTRLEDGVNQAVEKIRFAYGTSATAGGETAPELISYSNKYSEVPAVLANADLVLTQNGKDILSVPVQRLLVAADSQKPMGEADAFELDAIRVLKEKTDIKISLRFPNGRSIGSTANHFIELHFIGAQVSRK